MALKPLHITDSPVFSLRVVSERPVAVVISQGFLWLLLVHPWKEVWRREAYSCCLSAAPWQDRRLARHMTMHWPDRHRVLSFAAGCLVGVPAPECTCEGCAGGQPGY
jgi:hypothetical protein